MKAFIERIFRAKKAKRIVQEATAIADKFIQDKATQAAFKVIKVSKPEHTNDCECFKCINWRKQNAE